tara:strand:- start:1472 stop:2110 length:639 start_codon:yes stop_codon:yes gene_type:complete
MSFRFTLPIIILSTITGTANFAQESFPVGIQPYVPAGIGALNLGAAILTTVQQFLKVSELMESHRVSYIHYGKLARSIRLELTLPVTERGHDGNSLVSICRTEYDRLIEQSPPIPSYIIMRFENAFPEDKAGGKNVSFNRPEIMTIKPINPYDNMRETHLTRNVIERFRRGSIELNDPEDLEIAHTLADLASVEVPSSPTEIIVESGDDVQE